MQDKRVKALLDRLSLQGIADEQILQVMGTIPREIFVEEAFAHKAYENTALPIGLGQTISQPYVVARMTELLQLQPHSHVLEIGTGSGYQTAILASLVRHVYSVERIKSLQWQAKRRLKQLDLHNVSTRHTDGWEGWPAKSPFHAIIVTAAADIVPPSLLGQLADGGRLVIPVGEDEQFLHCIVRYGEEYETVRIEPVRFVPLVKGALS